MTSLTTLLLASVALLMIDSIMELAFISSTVAWLHARAGKGFEIRGPNGPFLLAGKPENFLLDQGHVSNAAAGTAFVVVGLGGLLVFWLRSRQLKRNGGMHGFVRFLYNFWFAFTIISAVFSLVAFIAVPAVTYGHDGQSIDVTVAAALKSRPYPNNKPYPLLQWTPQGWYTAMLQLAFVDSEARSDVESQLAIMHGWEWNLIPMLILGCVVMVLAILDRSRVERRSGRAGRKPEETRKGQDIELDP